MQSSNPVFRRAEGFNGRAQTYPASGMSYPAYGSPRRPTADPYAAAAARPPTPGRPPGPDDDRLGRAEDRHHAGPHDPRRRRHLGADRPTGRPAPTPPGRSTCCSMVGAFGGFALSMVNSFKRVVSPALVLAYAALEGLFVGAFSKVIEASFGSRRRSGGLVIGAVLGTMAAVAGTLAAYKFFNIRVGTEVPQVGRRRDVRLRRRLAARLRAGLLRRELRLQRLRPDGPALQRHRPRASAC